QLGVMSDEALGLVPWLVEVVGRFLLRGRDARERIPRVSRGAAHVEPGRPWNRHPKLDELMGGDVRSRQARDTIAANRLRLDRSRRGPDLVCLIALGEQWTAELGGEVLEAEVPLIAPDSGVEVEHVVVGIDGFVDPIGDDERTLLVTCDRVPDDPNPVLIRNRRDSEGAAWGLATVGRAAAGAVDLVPLADADAVRIDRR